MLTTTGTMATFADDVAWMCAELDAANPVIVGHSMGGAVALETAARHPDLPSGVVLVDPAPILPTAESTQILHALADSARDQGVPATLAMMEPFLFLPTDPAEERSRIVGGMSSAPQHSAASAMRGIATWDGASALRACRVPGVVIWAGDVPPNMPEMQGICPALQVGKTVGAGHFHQLLVPDQVNAMIGRFLEVSVPVPAGA